MDPLLPLWGAVVVSSSFSSLVSLLGILGNGSWVFFLGWPGGSRWEGVCCVFAGRCVCFPGLVVCAWGWLLCSCFSAFSSSFLAGVGGLLCFLFCFFPFSSCMIVFTLC